MKNLVKETVRALFRVQDSRCRVQDSRCRVQDSRCRIQDPRFRIQGSTILFKNTQ
jgi:hypothetical protein